MDKTSLQKKFRFIMVIVAASIFVTILTPAYIHYSSSNLGWPKVIMMWTVLFGGSKAKFTLSWFAFAGYMSIIVVLIIALLRKFVTINTDNPEKKSKEKTEKKKTNRNALILDAVSLVFVLISLVMFILLPVLITDTSCTNTFLIDTYYGWGFSYILIYLCLTAMIVLSLMTIYIEVVVAVLNKFKKTPVETKAEVIENKEEAKVEVKEEVKETETKVEVKEEAKAEEKAEPKKRTRTTKEKKNDKE